jgi:hypothetical protein
MILPRTLGKRTGAWAWQYSALLYWESLVEHPLLAHTRPSLNRLEGRVMPLMAAPLTMSDIWALLDLGLLAENLWVPRLVPGTGSSSTPLFALLLCGPTDKSTINDRRSPD